MLRALAQLMVLRVLVVLVSSPSVLVRGKVLDIMVSELGQGMAMAQVAPLVLDQREAVSIAPSFLL